MEIKDIRRTRLIAWFANRSVPANEKSYLSQLMGGTASFGERAARRLEGTYGMGDGYLDAPIDTNDPDALRNTDASIVTGSHGIGDNDLQRAMFDQAKLLLLYWSADTQGRAAIMGAAETEANNSAAISVRDSGRHQSQ